jgi:hypothetical protein
MTEMIFKEEDTKKKKKKKGRCFLSPPLRNAELKRLLGVLGAMNM